jgi:hypothetical protein
MKVFVLTLALVGSALSMPVGVEQDHPRSVVPLVITDYSSVASKKTPEDILPEAPKEPAVKEEEETPEKKPAASEDKPETAPAPVVGDTNPADDALAEKAPAPTSDNQQAANNDSVPADVPLQQVPADSDAASQKKEEQAETSEAEASSSQDAPVVKPAEEKVSDEITPPAPVAPALNIPKNDEKADESSSSETKLAEETKEQQQIDDKKVKTEETKPVESESPAAAAQNPVEKPLDKAEEITADELVKGPLKVDEPTKGEAQENPVTSRRKRATDGKEDEKKKPTEVTKKEKDEKKVKADDAPVKNVEAVLEEVKIQEAEAPKIDDQKPEEAASEIKPVELPKPNENVPEVKPEESVKKADGADAVPALPAEPEVSADNAEKPAQIEGNKNVEANEGQKIELPITEVEKTEKDEESKPQETKIVPEAVAKETEKTSDEAVQVDEKKIEVASVAEEKKEVSSDEVSSDSVADKQDNVPATTIVEVVGKNPEPVADGKQSEEKEEGAKVAETASS